MSDVESTAPAVVAPVVAANVTAPEPVVPAEQATESPQEGDDSQQAAKPTGPTPEERAFQKRLGIESRRQRQIIEAQVRAEYAEKQLAELKAPKSINVQPSGEPVPRDYQDYESYIRAFNKWNVKEELKAERERIRQETQSQYQQRELEQVAVKVLPKFDAAREKYDDFDDVVRGYLPSMPQAAHDAVIESDIPDELLYHLGQNNAERERIFRLSPVAQVKAISALESKLTAPPSATKTPAPIVPNSGKSPVSKNWQDMSTEEFFDYRRKRLAAKRGR